MDNMDVGQERHDGLVRRARAIRDGVLGAAWTVACVFAGLAESIRAAVLLVLGASLAAVAVRWAHERWMNVEHLAARRSDGDAPVRSTSNGSEDEVPATSKKWEELTAGETKRFRSGTCPDCLGRRLVEGPRGGLAVNVYCTDPRCGSKFNDGVVVVERISDRSPFAPPATRLTTEVS